MSVRHLTYSLLTALITCLACFLLGEVWLRLLVEPRSIPTPPPYSSFNPYRANKYIVNSRPYVYFHIPGARYGQKLALYTNPYSINSMGFRGENFTPTPSNGKKRLLVIGDSVVEGHGVQTKQAFPDLLRQRLAEYGWEVLNLGVQGASPIYFAANLERYLYLNPDAVLLLIHENDLYEDEIREKMYFNLPFLENRKILYSGGKLHPWYTRSRLLSFLATTFKTYSRTPLERIIEENNSRNILTVERRKTRKKRSNFIIPAEKIDQRRAMSEKYLNYFLGQLRSRNIKLFTSALCTVTLSLPHIQEYTTHCENLETMVKQWAEQHEVPYYSLVPSMRSALEQYDINEILIFNDRHPTPKSHEIFAENLFPFILNGITEKGSPAHASE